MAQERISPHHHAAANPEAAGPSYDAFVVIGLVAVIVGAATGSLAVAMLVFGAPALALGGALYLRSHS